MTKLFSLTIATLILTLSAVTPVSSIHLLKAKTKSSNEGIRAITMIFLISKSCHYDLDLGPKMLKHEFIRGNLYEVIIKLAHKLRLWGADFF